MSEALHLDPVRLGRAFDVVREHVTSRAVPAAVLAVADRRGVKRLEAFGRAHGGDDVDEDSVFWIASITKPIIATAVLQLAEEGRLALGHPVQRYLPEFTPPGPLDGGPGGDVVTTWHVLTHTAGLSDAPREVLERRRPKPEWLYRRQCSEPLLFPPGSRFTYASDSFYVLGELITRLSGRRYPDYLRQRILAPLGMTRTGFDPRQLDARAAPIHGLGVPRALLGMALRYVASLEAPGGGLWATAADIVRFGQAVLGGGRLGGARLLSQPFVELMTREHTAGILEPGVPPRAPHYGLGWGIAAPGGPSVARPGSFGHGGATGTILWVDPASDLVFVYLQNRWDDDMHAGTTALQAVYGALDSPD